MTFSKEKIQEIEMNKAIGQLEQEKGLRVIGRSSQNLDFYSIIFVENNKKEEYSMKIIPLSSDQSESICPIKLRSAQKYAQGIQKLKHENILKYCSEFQIGSYYFIQMEQCGMSFQNWIDQNNHEVLDRKQFIRFSIEILKAVEYLHQQDYLIPELSLTNILIDKKMKIKICEFRQAQEVNLTQITQKFLSQKVKNSLFYLYPEFFDLKQNLEISDKIAIENQVGDIWVVGACLYRAAGAEFYHLKKFTKGLHFYQIQQNIDIDINMILQNILQLYPKGRPSIQQIIDSFSKLKVDLDNKVQLVDQQFHISQNKETEDQMAKEFNQLFDLGLEQYDNENFKDAIEYFQKALKLNPQSCKTYNYIGESLFELNSAESISYYKKAIEVNQMYLKPYNNLGKQYYEKDMYDEAIECCQKAIQLFPDNAFAYNGLGNSYRNRDQYEEAFYYFKKTLEINPFYYFAYYNLGLCYYDMKEYDKAIDHFKQLIEYLPNDIDSYFNLGNSYIKKQMNKQAIQAFEQGLLINPQDLKLLLELAGTYNDMKNEEEAISILKKAIKIDNKFKRSYNELGNIYFEQQKLNQSKQCYLRAVRISPKYEIALYNLGLALNKQQKYDQSLIYFKRSAKTDQTLDSKEMITYIKQSI